MSASRFCSDRSMLCLLSLAAGVMARHHGLAAARSARGDSILVHVRGNVQIEAVEFDMIHYCGAHTKRAAYGGIGAGSELTPRRPRGVCALDMSLQCGYMCSTAVREFWSCWYRSGAPGSSQCNGTECMHSRTCWAIDRAGRNVRRCTRRSKAPGSPSSRAPSVSFL